MNNKTLIKNLILLTLSITACCANVNAIADGTLPTGDTTASASKKIYRPTKIWMAPDSNNFNNDSSEYSNIRKVESLLPNIGNILLMEKTRTMKNGLTKSN